MMSVRDQKYFELRVKHLEMLQATIARMSGQSATLKNYCVTLITAVGGFAITLAKPNVALLALAPIAAFALLDARYLQRERLFRAKYERVRLANWRERPTFEISAGSLKMDSFMSAFFSWSVLNFYGPMGALVILAVFIGRYFYGWFV